MIGNYLWPEYIEAGEKFVCMNCSEEVFCHPRHMPPKFCRLCFYRHLRYDDSEHVPTVWNLPEDFETQEAFEELKAKRLADMSDGCHVFTSRFEFEDAEAHIKSFLVDGHYPKSFVEVEDGSEKEVLASDGP